MKNLQWNLWPACRAVTCALISNSWPRAGPAEDSAPWQARVAPAVAQPRPLSSRWNRVRKTRSTPAMAKGQILIFSLKNLAIWGHQWRPLAASMSNKILLLFHLKNSLLNLRLFSLKSCFYFKTYYYLLVGFCWISN